MTEERDVSETWYVVERWRNLPTPIEVLRHTDSSVWTADHRGNPERSARHAEYRQYYPTQAEAVAAIRARLESQIKRAQDDLLKARSALGQLDAMRTAPTL